MKKYIGTKQVEAEPMTMGEAYEKGLLHRDASLCDGDKQREGYFVKYKDGYESWSPAEPFEEAYKCCDTFLDRLMIEQEELSDKLQKLRQFIESPKFEELVKDNYQRLLLVKQENYMHEYLEILDERIRVLKRDHNI